MNFTDVVNQVISISKRPDKVLDIRRMVNGAINFCCVEADFARDLVEDSYSISSSLYSQSLPLSTFQRFRKFQYVRPSNRTCYINPLSADKVFQRGGTCDSIDKYYVAGDNFVFQLGTLADNLIIGYFAYPIELTDAAPDFWLLEIAPYMIIDKAAAKLFGSIGDEKSATYHEGEFRIAFDSAKKDLKYGFKP